MNSIPSSLACTLHKWHGLIVTYGWKRLLVINCTFSFGFITRILIYRWCVERFGFRNSSSILSEHCDHFHENHFSDVIFTSSTDFRSEFPFEVLSPSVAHLVNQAISGSSACHSCSSHVSIKHWNKPQNWHSSWMETNGFTCHTLKRILVFLTNRPLDNSSHTFSKCSQTMMTVSIERKPTALQSHALITCCSIKPRSWLLIFQKRYKDTCICIHQWR